MTKQNTHSRKKLDIAKNSTYFQLSDIKKFMQSMIGKNTTYWRVLWTVLRAIVSTMLVYYFFRFN